MNPWKTLPTHLPTDGQTVWVRINYWFGQAFLATWSVADQTFTDSVSGLIYPAWSVMRWRPNV